MPIGGIGAGKIEFCPNGRFTNITINNNVDAPIVDGFARIPLFPRIKEGAPGSLAENAIRRRSVHSPEGLPGGFLAVHTPADGAVVLKSVCRPAFRGIAPDRMTYEGRFPLAKVDYSGFAAIDLHLDAYSAFDPIDPREDCYNSSLPLALFALAVTGRGPGPTPATLAFSWQNLNGIGGYPMTMINDQDATSPVFREDADGPGLWFGHDPGSRADPRVLGDYSLRVLSPDVPAAISACAGWNPAGEGRDVWEAFARGGVLDNAALGSTAGALAARVVLQPGKTATIVFALGWFMPRLLAAETEWHHLVRPSYAPPAPTGPHRKDYGHAYQNWFPDSWAVAGTGLSRWRAIRDRILDWQGRLDRSSLPPLAVTGLCNDLCALLANTWYTRDGHYAVNEAPTDMNGCLGTIDQRSVGNGAVALSFPRLNKAELALFAADQVREEGDPRRFGRHWNARTGHFDLPLDRAGAILHDYGYEHLEGGRTGDAVWPSLHWPELSSHFVLQVYQYCLWSGDAAWLDAQYPGMKRALAFQDRLDQDGDGVADLWGPGSFTYDTELYPHFGASAYVASLYLAALRVMIRLAGERRDDAYAEEAQKRFDKARRVLEEELFDDAHGYYTSWRDLTHAAWSGSRAHGPRSASSHISQLAGCWWADMLDLGPIVDGPRRLRALDFIGRHNVAEVAGCPADEYHLDGTTMQSMSALAMGNYAAHAIGAGSPDHGWAAVERIYRARYAHDGCPWDATLQWSGPGNLAPQWGRWYMSHPASWYLLPALGGIRLDRLRGSMTLAPSWPAAFGSRLRALPVFVPGLQLEVNAERTEGRLVASVTVQAVTQPLALRRVRALLPRDFDPARTTARFTGLDAVATIDSEGRVSADHALTLGAVGDGFGIVFDRV